MKWHSWWSASTPEERHICRNRPSKFPAPAERHMQCELEVEQPGTTGFSRESNQIKLNQTSVKIHPAISRAPTARPYTSPGQRPGFVPGTPSALKGRPSFPIKAQSRQKPLQSCLIKANQGKRQIRILVLCLANPPAGSGGLAGERSRRVPGRNPLLGERI